MELPKLTGPFTRYEADRIADKLKEDYCDQNLHFDNTDFRILHIVPVPYDRTLYDRYCSAYSDVMNKFVNQDAALNILKNYHKDEFTIVAHCQALGNVEGFVKIASINVKEIDIAGNKVYTL